MTVINDYSQRSFTDVAERRTSDYSVPTILRIRATGTQAPIFCIHPIDGLASCYAALAAHIDEDHPLYGVEAPMTGDRSVSLTALAARYADGILAVHRGGPIHLLGLSLGGLLAHAVAVELQGRGVTVQSLTLLGSEPLQPCVVSPDEQQNELLAAMGDDIDRSRAEELLAVATHNEALASRHFPGVYVGNALVVSTEGFDVGTAWHPFVSGTVAKYLVPDAAAFALVGPLVNSYI